MGTFDDVVPTPERREAEEFSRGTDCGHTPWLEPVPSGHQHHDEEAFEVIR